MEKSTHSTPKVKDEDQKCELANTSYDEILDLPENPLDDPRVVLRYNRDRRVSGNSSDSDENATAKVKANAQAIATAIDKAKAKAKPKQNPKAQVQAEAEAEEEEEAEALAQAKQKEMYLARQAIHALGIKARQALRSRAKQARLAEE
jgi:hypothetical protein